MLRAHADEIYSVAEGMASGRDADVLASWLRCLKIHNLNPEDAKPALIHTQSRLRLHQQELEEFTRRARFGLEDLYSRVTGMGYVLLLTDAKGVTVDFIGDEKVDRELRNAGLYVGAEWSEATAGTCGVGACLATGEPIVVHQSDHFDYTHTPLSCTSVPIYDVYGNLLSVLDISLLQSQAAKSSQALALEVVKSCARRIEMSNLMSTFGREWVVRLSSSPEFVDVDPQAAFAINGLGNIAGMTRGAQRVLAASLGTDLKSPEKLIGRPFGDFFEFDFNRISELTRGAAPEERLLVTRNGDVKFAHAIMPPPPLIGRMVRSETMAKSLSKMHNGDLAMERLVRKVARIADTQISVILHGETGVGKEFIATAIHEARRKKGPFVAINCAALPENLIESELFGYLPGAFTGANAKGKKGLIEMADGGTLFLDEIGDMPLALQARLLRVLAEKEVTPVGGTHPVKVNIRILSASHRSLQELVDIGQFRQDLYYRLNGVILEIPSVRQRTDVSWLISMCLCKVVTDATHVTISPAAMKHMCDYDWPGNVREILSKLELMVALCDNNQITAELVAEVLPGLDGQTEAANRPDEEDNLESPVGVADATERNELVRVLKAQSWNISAASRALSIDRATLHRRMKRLAILSPNNGG
jgi:transcriptional regulator of acetoin/glycerol metabolism